MVEKVNTPQFNVIDLIRSGISGKIGWLIGIGLLLIFSLIFGDAAEISPKGKVNVFTFLIGIPLLVGTVYGFGSYARQCAERFFSVTNLVALFIASAYSVVAVFIIRFLRPILSHLFEAEVDVEYLSNIQDILGLAAIGLVFFGIGYWRKAEEKAEEGP